MLNTCLSTSTNSCATISYGATKGWPNLKIIFSNLNGVHHPGSRPRNKCLAQPKSEKKLKSSHAASKVGWHRLRQNQRERHRRFVHYRSGYFCKLARLFGVITTR